MGNQNNCCSLGISTSTSQYELQIPSPKQTTLKENQQNLDFENQSECAVVKSVRTSANENCLGLNKLYDLHLTVTKFNSGYLENTEQNVVTQAMDQDSYFGGGTTQSKLTDYICFKKYSPKLHYVFTSMLCNSKNHKIYLVMNKKSNIKRAIKVQKPTETDTDKINKSSNLISMIDQLDHPNLIRILEVYQYKQRNYFVMEYMDGGSLKDSHGCKLAKKICGYASYDMYFQQIKIIVKQILYALCFLHDKNIQHLNIQPKNILLSNKLGSKKIIFSKLTGFGYSRKATTDNLTELDEQIKKCLIEQQQLIAPELSEKGQVSCKTDIWLLGMAIFTTITKVKINRIQNYRHLKELMIDVWKKMEQNLQISQNQCFELILKMVQIDVNKRLTALQCLQQPWFRFFYAEQYAQTLRQNSQAVLKQAMFERKSNNLIHYIQSLIVYRNINQKQMSTISQIFRQLDKDKDGKVAIEQLIQYIQNQIKQSKSGLQNNEEQTIFDFCLQLITSIDKNNSGSIDYSQFTQGLIFMFHDKHITRDAIEEIFDHMDGNGDGQIAIDELKNSLKCFDMEELEYYMTKLDKDFDGSVRRDQFVNYCMQKFSQKLQKRKRKNSEQFLSFNTFRTTKTKTKDLETS